MKISIEKTIEVYTDRTIEGLNAIIEHALKAKSTSEFNKAIQSDDRIQDLDFFIYMVSSHIAIHEILPNGEKSDRLLFITS